MLNPILMAAAALGLAAAAPVHDRAWVDANVRLNQIQVIGSHNSYHQAIAPSVFARLRGYDPVLAPKIDYVSHLTLTEQLDLGLRHLEIDVFNDPKGGLYATPQGEAWAAAAGDGGPPFDPDGRMRRPGFKVVHFPDVDYRTSCLLYVDCLGEIRRWSKAHPGHLPIFLHGNAKEPPARPFPWGGPMPPGFDAAVFRALEAEVLSVFPRDELITPDDVRGDAPTLMEGVRRHGWPALGAARGKVVLVIDGGARQAQVYLGGDPSMKGRLYFSDSHDPATPTAGYTVVMDARDAPAAIPGLVRSGLLVRTLADFEMIEPVSGDASRQAAAVASGAQVVSTDFYRPDPRYPSGYRMQPFSGGRWFRCNPVNAPAGCDAAQLEPSWP